MLPFFSFLWYRTDQQCDPCYDGINDLLFVYNAIYLLNYIFPVYILFPICHGPKSAEIFVVEKIFNHHANCKLIHNDIYSIIYRYVLFMKTTDGEFNLNIFPLVLIYLFLFVADSIPHCIYSHNSNSISTQLSVQQINWCLAHIECCFIHLHVLIILYQILQQE